MTGFRKRLARTRAGPEEQQILPVAVRLTPAIVSSTFDLASMLPRLQTVDRYDDFVRDLCAFLVLSR